LNFNFIKLIIYRLTNNEIINDTETTSDISDFKDQSVDSILAAAQIVYNEEIGRFNQIENKTNISMAFSGVLLGVLFTVYNLNIFNNNNFPSIIYMFYIIKILNLFLMCKAFHYFSRSIKSSDFNQFPLNHFFKDYSYFERDPNYVKIEIASSLNLTIQENISQIAKKIKYYDDGNTLIFVSLIIFIIIWSLEKIVNVML